MITERGRYLGSKLSSPDSRDHRYPAKLTRGLLEVPPPVRVDRRTAFPGCWNQTNLGCCEGHGGAAKMWEMFPGFMASRLAIYYWGRYLEGTVPQDVGMETRNLMKVLQAGVMPEDRWQYDINRFADTPPINGLDIKAIQTYSRLSGQDELVDCLASEGSVIFSFQVPEAFDGTFVEDTGILVPSSAPKIIAGHCVLAVGYDLDFRNGPNMPAEVVSKDLVDDAMVLVRNSWGPAWGMSGYFWIPMTYMLDPATGDDAWACHLANGPAVAGVSL